MAGKLKKGSLVKVIREQLVNSVEVKASDDRLPDYLFNSKGLILEVDDDYALVQFYVATPNVWLRLDQLEAAS